MADFHSNQFVLAANERDMTKALFVMANNMAQNGTLGFVNAVDITMSPTTAFSKIRNDIEEAYWEVFPINHSASTNGGGYFGAGYSETINGGPLSDTANVSLHKLGRNYALMVDYSTADVSNEGQFGLLLDQLSDGRYGYSFMHSDDDGRAVVSFWFGVADGGMPEDAPLSDEGSLSPHRFFKYAEPYWTKDYSGSSDLGLIAFALCSYYWIKDRADFRDKLPPDNLSFRGHGYGRCQIGASGMLSEAKSPLGYAEVSKAINWHSNRPQNLERLRAAILGELGKMPCMFRVYGGFCPNSLEQAEQLLPCDEVVLKTNWESAQLKPVAIEVFASDGQPLGVLGNVGQGEPSLEGMRLAALACLVPYLRAYVWDVKPLSIRSAKSKHAEIVVAVQASPIDIPRLFEEVNVLMVLPRNERVRSSIEGWW